MKKRWNRGLREYDRLIIESMYKWGIRSLRISLGIVFLWFGLLKIINETPVEGLIQSTYGFMPQDEFIAILGFWEIVIGLGLIFKVYLRMVLILLWMQMIGIFTSVILAPSVFFHENPLFLTLEGEFVVKNLVLISASLVIGGYRIQIDREKISLQPRVNMGTGDVVSRITRTIFNEKVSGGDRSLLLNLSKRQNTLGATTKKNS